MYRYLDHPSEALVEVTGATVEEVFRDAAIALFEMMTDLSSVKTRETFSVELSSSERHLLLIDWLNRLILLHEVKKVFLNRFDIQIEKRQDWSLKALAGGERIGENHERRLYAKSATYGQLEWQETPDGHRVRFVIDV